MTVRNTSKQAFLLSARRTAEQAVVEEITRGGPGTRLDIAKRLGREVNTITAAVLVLVTAGILKEDSYLIQPATGRKAWKLSLKEAV